jgi:hypothetical protein
MKIFQYVSKLSTLSLESFIILDSISQYSQKITEKYNLKRINIKPNSVICFSNILHYSF